MATINVSIPKPMQEWVEDRIRSGEYGSASDYIGDLIRYDRERHKALIEALIQGEESGVSSRTVSEIIADTKSKILNGES